MMCYLATKILSSAPTTPTSSTGLSRLISYARTRLPSSVADCTKTRFLFPQGSFCLRSLSAAGSHSSRTVPTLALQRRRHDSAACYHCLCPSPPAVDRLVADLRTVDG